MKCHSNVETVPSAEQLCCWYSPEMVKRMWWTDWRVGLHSPYSVTHTNISRCVWNGVQQKKKANTTTTVIINYLHNSAKFTVYTLHQAEIRLFSNFDLIFFIFNKWHCVRVHELISRSVRKTLHIK